MNSQFLYRGIHAGLHAAGVALRAKVQGAFLVTSVYGDASYGSGETYGISDANAVLRHQLNQAGLETSGVSTTPHLSRAAFYATNGPSTTRYSLGYVYKIDRALLISHGIREFVVSQYVSRPSVPEDDEVILVAPDGELPESLIVEIIKVDGS